MVEKRKNTGNNKRRPAKRWPSLSFLFRPIEDTPPRKSNVTEGQMFIVAMLLSAGIAGAMYFTYQLKKPDIPPPSVDSHIVTLPTPEETPKRVQFQLNKSVPIALRINSINLEAPVMKVGKLSDSTMETPPALEWTTGWYRYSPTPGEIGPAIIVGHVDNLEGTSVFWRLRELKPGDIVEVIRADKSTARFKVTGLKEFNQDNFPTKQVYGAINHAGLRLITCSGTFNPKTGHYDSNTVVFAQLIKNI